MAKPKSQPTEPTLDQVLESRGFQPAPEQSKLSAEQQKLLDAALKHYDLERVLRAVFNPKKPDVVKLIVGDGRKLWYPEEATPFRPTNYRPAKTRKLLEGLHDEDEE